MNYYVLSGLMSLLLLSACGDQTKAPSSDSTQASSPKEVASAPTANIVKVVFSKNLQDVIIDSSKIVAGGRCFVDSFNGKVVSANNEVEHSSNVVVEGWAVNAQNKAETKIALQLTSLDGLINFYAPAERTTRAGLGKALGDESLDHAALQSTASLSQVTPGKYIVKVIVASGQDLNVCEPNIQLIVK